MFAVVDYFLAVSFSFSLIFFIHFYHALKPCPICGTVLLQCWFAFSTHCLMVNIQVS